MTGRTFRRTDVRNVTLLPLFSNPCHVHALTKFPFMHIAFPSSLLRHIKALKQKRVDVVSEDLCGEFTDIGAIA